MPLRPTYFPIHFKIIPSTLRSSKRSTSVGSPHQSPMCNCPSAIHSACPAHLIILDVITQMIFGEQYRSSSSSLRNLLHFPVTSSLLGQNILPRYVYILFWAAPVLRHEAVDCCVTKFCLVFHNAAWSDWVTGEW